MVFDSESQDRDYIPWWNPTYETAFSDTINTDTEIWNGKTELTEVDGIYDATLTKCEYVVTIVVTLLIVGADTLHAISRENI
jgi:hypothetical protein